MSRFIDADKAKEVICKYENRNIQKQMIYAIERIPDADVAEVVRCKDCKYIEEHHYEDEGELPYIKYTCKSSKGYQVQLNDFCSRGEKSNMQNTHIPNSGINPDYADLHDKFIGRKRG